MSSQEKSNKHNLVINEDAIFKSLSHEIGRDIFRYIGNKKGSTFTDIRNSIGSIDSPTLPYHLKSLVSSIIQKVSKFILSKIRNISFNLLKKIDSSENSKS